MDKNEILAVLNDWNSWRTEQSTGVVRAAYLGRLEGLLTSNQVITITGPRRAGKSYLMRQMAKKLTEQGVKKENILLVNFEDPRFSTLDAKLMTQIFDVYKEFLSPTGIPYIFFDEVQEVEGWEKWVRMMHELKKAKIVVSGSNAKLLSRELGTLLTGRHLDLTVFPLSFTEFLAFNKITIIDNLDIAGKEAEIRGLFRRYMEFGSFPEVVLSEQKREILLKYFEDLLVKDLFKRFSVRKPQVMKSLIKYYLSNIGNLTTFMSTERFLHASADTIEKFAGYFEDVYLVFFLKRFSFKVKEQEKSPRKVYAIDPGLCNSVGFRFSENVGRLAENIVFLALKKRQVLNPELELYYWKDEQHREVDFVLKDGTKTNGLIQVCWNLTDEKTRNRETKSLLKAMDELKIDDAVILTDDYETTEEHKGKKIIYTALWKWLLLNDGVVL
ncbi:MAG: ATP-binding protein [Candidatus Omnitrophota bacterium]